MPTHRRFTEPSRLPGATNFSHDPVLSDPIEVVRLLKTQRWATGELRRVVAGLERNWGRRREPGDWALAYVAFTVSGHVDIQPWHAQTADELWRECEFLGGKPHYRRVYRHFRELEQVAGAFLDAAGKAIRHARRHDARVGAHWHVDGTEDETHASLLHDCQEGENCQYREREPRRSGRAHPGGADRPQRVSTAVARQDRQQLATEAVPESLRDERLRRPEKVQLVVRDGRVRKRLRINSCWYLTRDLDAGIRAYTGPRGATRFWHGYYNQKVIDHFTGGVLYAGVFNASCMEFDLFDELYGTAVKVVGGQPETVTADKGFSVAKCFERCTENGSAPIFPWRPAGGDFHRHDHDTHDRHGVPRCRHCGGPTSFVRFSVTDRGARLWFRCMLGVDDGCAKDQTILCGRDYRLLLPLWRTDPLYHELKESHSSYEGAHRWWRQRYRVAAASIDQRPKVCSIGAHRLRANCAALVEWLRICAREGWLGSARRNHREPTRDGEGLGCRIAERLAGMRRRMGLTAPYGVKAGELGIGESTPPSRRPRGRPPDQVAPAA